MSMALLSRNSICTVYRQRLFSSTPCTRQLASPPQTWRRMSSARRSLQQKADQRHPFLLLLPGPSPLYRPQSTLPFPLLRPKPPRKPQSQQHQQHQQLHRNYSNHSSQLLPRGSKQRRQKLSHDQLSRQWLRQPRQQQRQHRGRKAGPLRRCWQTCWPSGGQWKKLRQPQRQQRKQQLLLLLRLQWHPMSKGQVLVMIMLERRWSLMRI
mmetsp:Transcript_11562/g.31493  ORF Transcript_11562/g.31493 Transcript_11562/m.31493 type:complete len:209 (-) Transcript_11562:110-736(-)